jgi:hypothetical protein
VIVVVEEIKENQRPGAEPEITPDMVQSVFTTLESRGLVHHMKGGAYVPTEKGWKLLRGTAEGKEVITARGHENILARDENCFEITTNDDPMGEDSVVAVRADKGCRDLNDAFKAAAKTASRMLITIEAGGVVENVIAYGSPALELSDVDEIVIRKSDLIDGKTVGILADKSANEFSTSMKEKLKNPKTEVDITFEVK